MTFTSMPADRGKLISKKQAETENISESAPKIVLETDEPIKNDIISKSPKLETKDLLQESVKGKIDLPVINQVNDSDINKSQSQFEIKVIEAISTVFDPEIPVNIYELGLIYNININGMNDVGIDMTLTSPACPVAGTLPGDVERVVQTVEGVGGVKVELIWEPAWSPDRMSEAAKLELGFM
jgi:FeS assembly SUF system protein